MEAVRLTVRLPKPLLEQARQRAHLTGRSLNQLVVDAVRREVERPWPEPLPGGATIRTEDLPAENPNDHP